MNNLTATPPFSTDSSVRPVSRLRVLVVDDSKLQRKIVSTSLTKWGFDVTEASDGSDALEACRKTTFDLVVSDWMMPGMDGLEFCREFRKLKRDRYGYFILLTSKNEKNDVATGLDIGADDFLSKPVNSAELKARVRAGTRVLDMEHRLIEQNETVQNALDELQVLYDTIDNDLAQAAKFQQSLIPRRHALVPGGEVAILFQCSSHVGGDLTGFFRFDDNRMGLYSIDVSGHGISSALLTARLAGWLSPHAREANIAYERNEEMEFRIRTPDAVASELNARMFRQIDTEHYCTFCYADIDLTSGDVQMVQAGHPHPALIHKSGGITFMGQGGLPIGLIEDAAFETVRFRMQPGDRLLLYSDGITECQNSRNELLGEAGLSDIIEHHRDASTREVLSDLLWDLTAFAANRTFNDDVSALLFELHDLQPQQSGSAPA